jgi:hypothetical protein
MASALLLLLLLLCAGVCGDPTQEVFPLTDIANFRGPVTDYAPGSIVRFRVLMQVNHGGRLAFCICDRSSNLDQACFNSRQLLRCVQVSAALLFWCTWWHTHAACGAHCSAVQCCCQQRAALLIWCWLESGGSAWSL